MKLPIEARHLRASLSLLPALLLASAIGWEIDWGAGLRLPLPQAEEGYPRAAIAALQPEFSLQPLEQAYTNMVSQPLFVPTRHPAPALQTEPHSSMQKGQFLLEGVILSQDRNLALLREVATNKVLRVEQGKEIKGIRLEKLDGRSVTLQQGTDSEELLLKIPARPKVAPPPTPATVFGATPQPPSPAPAQLAPPQVPGAAPPGATGGFSMQSEIARRRALRGLPP